MTEPKQPVAVYRQLDSCRTCKMSSWWHCVEKGMCKHDPLPDGLSLYQAHVPAYGHCDYWEKSHD